MTACRSFLVAAALAGVAALAPAAAGTVTSDEFAPGWQDQTRALIDSGPSRLDLAKTSWFVPGITAPGRYVLIERHGDRAEVIDGYQFTVRAARDSEIHMIVPAHYGNVEALPIKYVPSLAARAEPPGSR
jgi:hypothetical protein